MPQLGTDKASAEASGRTTQRTIDGYELGSRVTHSPGPSQVWRWGEPNANSSTTHESSEEGARAHPSDMDARRPVSPKPKSEVSDGAKSALRRAEQSGAPTSGSAKTDTRRRRR